MSKCLPACMFVGLVSVVWSPAWAAGEASGQAVAAATDAQPAGEAVESPTARTLFVGDRAPKLTIATWVKGEPVASFEPERVYVVEFWATWCPPCRKSIPHLTSLQRRYQDRGVTVVGISSNEQRGIADVEPFVTKQGDRMGYVVGWDERAQTSRDWLDAAGQDGIPTAFIVAQDGRIAWIGHPLSGLDVALSKVVDKTLDIDSAARADRRRAELDRQQAPIAEKADEAYAAGDIDAVLVHLDKIIALDPPMQGEWIFEKYRVLADEKKDVVEALRFVRESADGAIKSNPEALNQIAWHMLSALDASKRDVGLAKRLAERASELTSDASPEILDTLAAAQFQTGDAARAVQTQRRAVELAPEGDVRTELNARLQEYLKPRPRGGG